jgi:predicted ABC-type ATPase
MAIKRMRVFAGPNGSGKTTIFKELLADKANLGVYVNADDIQAELEIDKQLNFDTYQLSVTNEQIQNFFMGSKFSPVKRNELDLWEKVHVSDNVFRVNSFVDSYLAADLAEFIRQMLLENDISFTYETVMSHPGKVDFLKLAQSKGYRVYLYFIATVDPAININRVQVRVKQHGHGVDSATIEKRYYKSLGNLRSAVKWTNRTFIFDNSQERAKFIAEITDGNQVKLNRPEDLTAWSVKYLFMPE